MSEQDKQEQTFTRCDQCGKYGPTTEHLAWNLCETCNDQAPPFGGVKAAEPTPDQSYCDVGNHQGCSGYTEDEADPESCMCSCHDEPFASELEAQHAASAPVPRLRPYTVVLGWDYEDMAWFVSAVLAGELVPVLVNDGKGLCVTLHAPEGADLEAAARELASAQEDPYI